MDIAALIVAVLALVGAFVAARRAAMLQEKLDRTTSQLHELRSATNATVEQLQGKVNEVSLQMRRQAGQPIFDPRMTIADAMGVHPKVVDVLASFHLGGCSHCAVSDVDTIEGACQTYGIDQASLMKALNGLVSGGSGGSAASAGSVPTGSVPSGTAGLAATVQAARIPNAKVSS
jgi:hybrid cluster-associated redox disulfide protein